MITVTGGRRLSELSETEKQQIVDLYQAGVPVTGCDEGGTPGIMLRFNLAYDQIVRNLVKRAGLPLHHPRVAKVKIDIDAELEAAKRKVAELEAAKSARAIRFEWAADSKSVDLRATAGDPAATGDGMLLIYGITPNFVKLGGMQKLLAFIERDCPQNRLGQAQLEQCMCGDFGVTRPGCPVHDRGAR